MCMCGESPINVSLVTQTYGNLVNHLISKNQGTAEQLHERFNTQQAKLSTMLYDNDDKENSSCCIREDD